MFEISFLQATFSAFLLLACFVGSLYFWKLIGKQEYPRDNPITIKRRFLSVLVTCILGYFYLQLFWEDSEKGFDMYRYLGIHTNKIASAAVVPLALTMILFFGPIILLLIEPEAMDPFFVPQDLRWWRNYVVGPITEEWIFRACMCPLLFAGGYGKLATILASPFCFGLAHLHHIVQHLHKQGHELRMAWGEVILQLGYTTIFGMYSTFLFLRTGHLIAPIIVHWFCNYMGFPRFNLLFEHPQKNVLRGCFIAGVIGYFIMLFPLTNPTWYDSLYWNS